LAQVGARDLTGGVIGNLIISLWVAGEWDEAVALFTEYQAEIALAGPYDEVAPHTVINLIHHARGEPVIAMTEFTPEGDPLSEFWVAIARSLEAVSRGDELEASRVLCAGMGIAFAAALMDDDVMIGWPLAIEQALVVGELAEAERMLTLVADSPPGLVHPLAHAHLLRARALVNRSKGADGAGIDADLALAIDELRTFGTPFYLAKALLERGAPEQIEEARAIFEQLNATPWLEKAQAALLVGS
jgi:hypothetical protein